MFIFSYWCWCVSITNEAAEPKFHTRGVAMLWTYKRFGETQIQTILGAGISRFSYPRWDGWSFPFFSVAALMSCRTRCTGWKSGDLAHILEWNIHCGIYKPMHREKKGSSREEVTFAKFSNRVATKTQDACVQCMSSFWPTILSEYLGENQGDDGGLLQPSTPVLQSMVSDSRGRKRRAIMENLMALHSWADWEATSLVPSTYSPHK